MAGVVWKWIAMAGNDARKIFIDSDEIEVMSTSVAMWGGLCRSRNRTGILVSMRSDLW